MENRAINIKPKTLADAFKFAIKETSPACLFNKLIVRECHHV